MIAEATTTAREALPATPRAAGRPVMCEVVNPCPELGSAERGGGGMNMGGVAGESASGDGEDEEEYGDKRGVNDEGQDGGVGESEYRWARGRRRRESEAKEIDNGGVTET
ncbi:hypothetical protein C8R46DRAFT_1037859 [Mycena filopes]|nr:hypothetical protein C8R46DRAFT_1037859 [Mycena filopes]